jgi:DeoR/GlpR family transcriptional regulator of sugar metabolism
MANRTGTAARTASRRRSEIVERVTASGHVQVRSLAEDLSVSEATVRRDLRQLARDRQIELVYGGATLPRHPDFSLQSRALRNVEAKRTAGGLAAGLVSDHEMLYVDGGTTCLEMRHTLRRRRGLSVIVNSWRWATELAGAPEVNIFEIGGRYRPERADCVGPLAAQSVDQMRGYVAFISADGLSADLGLWSNDIETAYLYKHVTANARDVVLVVDHSKFSAPSLFQICGWEKVSRVVTDTAPDAAWVSFFEERGITLVLPGAPECDTPGDSSTQKP